MDKNRGDAHWVFLATWDMHASARASPDAEDGIYIYTLSLGGLTAIQLHELSSMVPETRDASTFMASLVQISTATPKGGSGLIAQTSAAPKLPRES